MIDWLCNLGWKGLGVFLGFKVLMFFAAIIYVLCVMGLELVKNLRDKRCKLDTGE